MGLIFVPSAVKGYVAKLRKAKMVEFKAKDIFRASGLSLLGVSNTYVVRDQKNLESKAKIRA